MKAIFITLGFLLIIANVFAQDMSLFKERNYLKVKNKTYGGRIGIFQRVITSANYLDIQGNPLMIHIPSMFVTSMPIYTVTGTTSTYTITQNDMIDIGVDILMTRYILKKHRMYVDLKAEDGKVKIYPWPLVIKDHRWPRKYLNNRTSTINANANSRTINSYLNKYEFYLDLSKRKPSIIHYSSLQIGVLALPLKVYVAGQMTPINNVVFDANINFMIGYRRGRDRFVFLPNSKEPITSQRAVSFNFILGVSKISLDSAGTTSRISDKHDLAGISSGFALGFQYKTAGIYLATGLDLPIGRDSQQWNFYMMPWIGFGLGLKIN